MRRIKFLFENSIKPIPVSAGVLFTDGNSLLVGYSGTQWDLPKGGIDKNETPLQCAIREMYEETGYMVSSSHLQDLGKHQYLTGKYAKDLHLFLFKISKLPNISIYKCNSFYEDKKGIKRLEMTKFKYIKIFTISTPPTMVVSNFNNLENFLVFPAFICNFCFMPPGIQP